MPSKAKPDIRGRGGLPLALARLPPAALLQVLREMGLCHRKVVSSQPCRHGLAPGAGAKGLGMVLKAASSLTPWREGAEQSVRKLSIDGVDESCFLSTH